MGAHPLFSNVRLFAVYAGDDIDRWRELVGRRVVHRHQGQGIVTGVVPSEENTLIVKIRFDQDDSDNNYWKRRFSDTWFSDVSLPTNHAGIAQAAQVLTAMWTDQEGEADSELRKAQQAREVAAAAELAAAKAKHLADLKRRQAEEAEQLRVQAEQLRLQEEADAIQFATLKAKYRATKHRDPQPRSFLFPILLQIDEGRLLDEEQVAWLEANGLYPPLITYFEELFRREHDPWHLVKISRYWRRSDQPRRALGMSDQLVNDFFDGADRRLKSAILTTRGGTLRDLGKLDEAERAGSEAARYDPRSYYPYNLLGAISYQRGNPEQGEAYFEEARHRGAPVSTEEAEIKSALRRAGPEEARRSAEYLLQRDPDRYKWAQRYLTPVRRPTSI